jgi:2-oxo-3-(phosphooxy)propyl 3-oxoalkanoate synthase
MPEPIRLLTADGARSSGLSFDQPVPRQLVHRAAIAEVFVTDAVVQGDDHYLVGAQWPRDHAFYHPTAGGGTDPVLFAETIRQAMVYLAHRHQDVPLGSRFTGRDIAWELTDTAPLLVRAEPTAALLDARWTWLDRRRRRLRVDVILSVDGHVCGHGHISAAVLGERQYRILRRRTDFAPAGPSVPPVRPEPAAHVGRLRAKDVVVGRDPAGDGWRLLLDQSHPSLFDHPVDHVPLMGLMEAVRQIGHFVAHAAPAGDRAWSLTAFDAMFTSFIELDQPTALVVRSPHGDTGSPRRIPLTVDVEQARTTVATTRSVWSAA